MRDDFVDGCGLCNRYNGDVYYKQHDLTDLARRLARKPSKALAERAKAVKADLAQAKRMFAEHVATEHPEQAA